MAKVYPFAAFLPKAGKAADVATLPYDVMNRAEAKALAAGNADSFLRVTRSEIDLADAVDAYDQAVYAKAAENWKEISARALEQAAEGYFVYSLVMDGRRQTGIVACASVADYNAGIVRRHELTRKEKEDDRTRHISSLHAQTGPVFLTYRDSDVINAIVDDAMKNAPAFDFTAEDGIRHTGWCIAADKTETVRQAFHAIPILYIADGHHRAASASRTEAMFREQCIEMGEADRFLAVIFPVSQLKILAYNRVVADLNGMSSEEFLTKLSQVCVISDGAAPLPPKSGIVSMYLDGVWKSLDFTAYAPEDPIERLDVSLLQQYVLQPLLGIDDPRTSKRIDFVGGIRGTAELEKLVDSGKAKVAFSMYPTRLDQLMEVADANKIMPPKSTWFEPKLRDGLFVHVI